MARRLQPQEQRVLELRRLGVTTAEIARMLHVVPGRINGNVSKIRAFLIGEGFTKTDAMLDRDYLTQAAAMYVSSTIRDEIMTRVVANPETIFDLEAGHDARVDHEVRTFFNALGRGALPPSSWDTSHDASLRVVNAVPVPRLRRLLQNLLEATRGVPRPAINNWRWMIHLLDGSRARWVNDPVMVELVEEALTFWANQPYSTKIQESHSALESMELLAVKIGQASRFEELGVISMSFMFLEETRVRNTRWIIDYYGNIRHAARNVVRVSARPEQSATMVMNDLLKLSAFYDYAAALRPRALENVWTPFERQYLVATVDETFRKFTGKDRRDLRPHVELLKRQLAS